MTNKCVSEQGNTPITRSQGGSKAPNKPLSLLAWWFPQQATATVSNQLWEDGKSIYLGFDFLPSSSNVHDRERHEEKTVPLLQLDILVSLCDI